MIASLRLVNFRNFADEALREAIYIPCAVRDRSFGRQRLVQMESEFGKGIF